ncbi:MAG TPA: aldehyde dehydrogenase family protein [Acidimicrobiales bacterium]|jgi:aldehyde dehydrogenase (NAD+)|nr:aldehyde dehydrogenase family protein [Acidimicrobiales bacterium]
MAEIMTPAEVAKHLRRGYDSGLTRPLEWRRSQLRQLQRMLKEKEAEWLAALAADLHKPTTEGRATDIGAINAEISALYRHLGRWAEPKAVHVPVRLGVGRARVVLEPLGVVLVIAPWNYPIHLLLLPMAFAIAAGNAVVGKPSELAPATSALMARLVPQYLDERAVTIVEGGPEETTGLLEERWDHILYTGNGRVGRLVMAAAAKHLTPVTLELGGKSPVIVDRDADLDVAARRIAWGKFLNAGQTCLAPDYALVHRDVEQALLGKLTAAVRDFYGPDPQASRDYARIVNDRHLRRLSDLLADVDPGRIVAGGQIDPGDKYVAPTIVRDASWDEAVMADEIFGPILPVLPVPDVDAAIDTVNAHPRPLALYVFTAEPATAERVVARTSSGGVCVNGTVLQIATPGLPFGGVGDSGMGAYHGRDGLETFSHRKGVLDRATWFDPSFSYPPYTKLKDGILRRLFG